MNPEDETCLGCGTTENLIARQCEKCCKEDVDLNWEKAMECGRQEERSRLRSLIEKVHREEIESWERDFKEANYTEKEKNCVMSTLYVFENELLSQLPVDAGNFGGGGRE